MRDPDTPGGFNNNMAWRPVSSSATGDDMAGDTGPTTTDTVRYGMVLFKALRRASGRFGVCSLYVLLSHDSP